MKKLFITCLIFLLAIMPVFNAWANVAYLRTTAAGTEDCSSHGNACDSWTTAEAYAELTTVSALHKVLIYAGDTYTGQASPDIDDFIIGTYYGGEGTETEVVDATTFAAAGDYGTITHNSGGTIISATADTDTLTIRWLHIVNTDTNAYCINLQSDGSDDVTITDSDLDAASGSGGMMIKYTDGLEIHRNDINITGNVGIGLYGETGASVQIANGNITYNVVNGNGTTGDNIVLHADTDESLDEPGDHWYFGNNTSIGSNEDGFDIAFVDDVEIAYNYTSDNDYHGVNLSHGGSNYSVHHNYSVSDGTDTGGFDFGWLIIDNVNGALSGVDVHHNIVVGNYRNGIEIGGGDLDQIDIHHNTFVFTGARADALWPGLYIQSGWTGDVINWTNNIVYSSDDGGGTITALMQLGLDPDNYAGTLNYDNNLYCYETGGSCQSADVFSLNQTSTDDTLAEIQAAYSIETNSLQADPLFNVVASDWTLQDGSPAIRTGARNASFSIGFDPRTAMPPNTATTIIQSNPPTMGAYVHMSGRPASGL